MENALQSQFLQGIYLFGSFLLLICVELAIYLCGA